MAGGNSAACVKEAKGGEGGDELLYKPPGTSDAALSGMLRPALKQEHTTERGV